MTAAKLDLATHCALCGCKLLQRGNALFLLYDGHADGAAWCGDGKVDLFSGGYLAPDRPDLLCRCGETAIESKRKARKA